MKVILIALVFLGAIFATNAYGNEDKELSTTLEQGVLLTSVIAKNEAYKILPRSFMTYEKLVAIKFDYQKWRKETVIDILKSQNFFQDVPSVKMSLVILKELSLNLSDSQLSFLKGKVDLFNNDDLKGEFISMLSHLGEAKFLKENYPNMNSEIKKLAGPTTSLKMKPIKPSREKYSKWSKNRDFSNYSYTEHGVIYRGIEYRPGDILVNSLNHHADGLYTIFSDPMGFYAHSAFFVMIKKEDRVIPSIIESFERGVRIIPLNVFLDRKLTSYVEVVRPIHIKEEDYSVINIEGRKLVDYIYGYNFYTADDDDRYVTCTRVGEELYRKSNLPLFKANSFYSHPMIKKNLESLGLYDDFVLTPMDYLHSPFTQFIGVVDNNMFVEQLSRDLVAREIRKKMEVDQFNFKKFPFQYKFNNWAIGVINNDGLLAPVFRGIEGFNKYTFPKGPRKLMAFVEPLEKVMAKTVKKIQSSVSSMTAGQKYVSYEQAIKDVKLIKLVRDNSKKIQKVFK